MQRDLADVIDTVHIGRQPLPARIYLTSGSPFTWSWRRVDGDPLPDGTTVEIRFNDDTVWVGQRAADDLITWSQSAADVDAVLSATTNRAVTVWWVQLGVDPYIIARGDVYRR